MHDSVLPILCTSDYAESLLHVAWLVRGQRRILVFGAVELFPAEQPQVDGAPEQQRISSGYPGFRLFFARKRLSADAAISMYADAATGAGLLAPVGGCDQSMVRLEASPYLPEPAWPNLSLSMGAPYLPYGVQPRCHHLLPGGLGEALQGVLDNRDDIQWLEDRLFFSLADYPELMGSFHLLAHNPVYRALHVRLKQPEDGRESVEYTTELRHGQSLESLTLYQVEKRLDDYAGFQAIPLSAPVFVVPLLGVASEVEYTVVCETRGMLEKTSPAGFIRQISSSLGVASQQAHVHVPARGGKVDESYSVVRWSEDSRTLIGDEAAPRAFREYSKYKRTRDQKRQAVTQGQHWFEDEEVKAREFVRGLISNARERVWIIDPYFSTVELFRFALATTSPTVEVVMATSAEHLRGGDEVVDGVEAGEALFNQLAQFNEQYDFTVRVLTGDKSPIHDRFLVIDSKVWFLGNSLNVLGKRAGMLVTIPDPDPVRTRLEGIVFGERSKELEQWVNDRKIATQGAARQSGVLRFLLKFLRCLKKSALD